MIGIKVKEGESPEAMIRRFRKAVDDSGVMVDLRKHACYEKPSVRKKRKRAAARKRIARLARRGEG
jgi:small subunit ribosomal protein S21